MATRTTYQIRCHPDSIAEVKTAANRARGLMVTGGDASGRVILTNWHNVEIIAADVTLEPGHWVMDQVLIGYQPSGTTIPTF